jgi:hypothetical protein
MLALLTLAGSCIEGLLLVVCLAAVLWLSFGFRRMLAIAALLEWLALTPQALGARYGNAWVGWLTVVCWTGLFLLLFGSRLPPGIVPASGPWARKLLALLALVWMACALLAGLGAGSGRWMTVWLPLLAVYYLPLWDVLVRGWRPRGRQDPLLKAGRPS